MYETTSGKSTITQYQYQTEKRCGACGGELHSVPDLDGSFCSKCGKHYDEDAPLEKEPETNTPYNMETIKAYRGVPTNEICYGTEGKGKIKILIPFFYSETEAKKVIDQQIALLKYTKQKCKDEGLDIESKRN